MSTTPRPGRAEIDGVLGWLVEALVEVWELAEQGGPDFAGMLSAALQEVSEAVGGANTVVRSRPGSWEAAHVRPLAATGDDLDWGIGL